MFLDVVLERQQCWVVIQAIQKSATSAAFLLDISLRVPLDEVTKRIHMWLHSDSVRVRFRVRFQAVKVPIFGGFPVESPTKRANRLRALLRGLSLSEYGSEGGGIGFLLKIPRRGVSGGEGPRGREGICGEPGNFLGGGVNIFFRGRNVHQGVLRF